MVNRLENVRDWKSSDQGLNLCNFSVNPARIDLNLLRSYEFTTQALAVADQIFLTNQDGKVIKENFNFYLLVPCDLWAELPIPGVDGTREIP